MAYTALYREWRPKVFSDVIGQEHITTTLINEIKAGRIGHAYLFSGTRGTGKTTCAKIMAKALNCLRPVEGEPCNECDMCRKIDSGMSLDVVEQDAATNNKVDDIRDLVDEVQYPPHEGKYKVYILDEVHMLSTGAVNAFLKTLEEPPEHVVFILATTDPQKLPVTILSRCQRFDFKRISYKEIARRLRRICEQKGIFAEDKSLELIARISDGAMRDALSIMDQAISMGEGKLDYGDILDMLGLSGQENLFRLSEAMLAKDVKESIRILDEVVDGGKDPYSFTKDLITHFRNILVAKIMPNPEEVVDLSKEDIEIIRRQGDMASNEVITRIIRMLQRAEEQAKFSKQSRIYLELAIISLTKSELDSSKEAMLGRLSAIEDYLRRGVVPAGAKPSAEAAPARGSAPAKAVPESPQGNPHEELTRGEELKVVKNAVKIEEEVFNDNCTVTLDLVKRNWKEIMEALKARRQMIIQASVIVGAPVKCDRGVIEVRFGKEYAFSKKRLEKKENREILEDAAASILGEKVRFRFVVEGEKAEETPGEDPGSFDAKLREFGIDIVDE
ncbi:DNA polymerase III subunit gamma/tau [Proteiniclasticum sp. BAD-10]|uniref:DNA-directed DNA polymerase n=1 Tax=Proteiniclasticum sediminis TaxID=2804028 RepID=A0A941CRH6_9CLOT|nr:DNA polymerase III subunit gamma/tau [Proteiniclasticum sediminis]MBR0576804.1 DNA polymerase III subunit gamma/tau [Proteiniclasticum sediminis]